MEGQDEFAGAVISIMGRTPVESGREVRLYSSGLEDLVVCLVIDWRLSIIRHTWLYNQLGKDGVEERRPTAIDSVAFSTLQQRINRGCNFIYRNAHGVIYMG